MLRAKKKSVTFYFKTKWICYLFYIFRQYNLYFEQKQNVLKQALQYLCKNPKPFSEVRKFREWNPAGRIDIPAATQIHAWSKDIHPGIKLWYSFLFKSIQWLFPNQLVINILFYSATLPSDNKQRHKHRPNGWSVYTGDNEARSIGDLRCNDCIFLYFRGSTNKDNVLYLTQRDANRAVIGYTLGSMDVRKKFEETYTRLTTTESALLLYLENMSSGSETAKTAQLNGLMQLLNCEEFWYKFGTIFGRV